MPYRFVFVPWPPDRPWAGLAEAERLRERLRGGAAGRALDEAESEAWRRVVGRVGPILGPVEEERSPEVAALASPADGIRLALEPGRAELTVPDDESAAGDMLEVMRRAYAVAHVVEAETGLRGYDPQLGEPVTDDPLPRRARRPPARRGDLESYESAGARARPVPADALRLDAPTPPPARPPSRRRPWWRFW